MGKSRSYTTICDGKEHDVVVTNGDSNDQSVSFSLDGKDYEVDIRPLGRDEHFSVLLDGKSFEVIASVKDGKYYCMVEGMEYEVVVEDELARLLKDMGGLSSADSNVEAIKAPMPGLIIEIRVQVGDRVTKGDGIAVMEAMKMENELTVAGNGVVSEVLVQKGENVDQGQVLVKLTAES
jgi:acetyl/propionyl-CoA carboxylase alpha subunit